MHNASCQNCLALDYLLASEGDVSTKLNLSNCYLEIDDKEEVIEKKINDRMRRVAYILVQAWNN